LFLKISTFGLSKWKNYSRSHTGAGGRGGAQGTRSHVAPELWPDKHPPENDKSDVYSSGILMWEMFTEEKADEGKAGKL